MDNTGVFETPYRGSIPLRQANIMNNNRQPTFSVRKDITLFNKINNEAFTGDIVNETDIEGRPYWIFCPANRPTSRLLMAKDAYTISKFKK